MTFEKHLRFISRAASQRLGILRKSWRVFHDRSLHERCFCGFVLPVFEYFITGGVCECDIAHRRSVAVLCLLYKIRCNQLHPLKRGARTSVYLYAAASRRTSQSRMTFVPFSVSLWNDLADLVFDSVGLVGFKSTANVFLLA